ncbi:MAG: preprotein translocase subunit SecG [Candidatus Tyrphobacter sp.]
MRSAFTIAAAPPAAPPSIAPGPLQSPPPQVTQIPTWWQMHASWFTHTIAGIFVICAILLIVLLAVQTTKQEGLSGTIGGRVESAYRGRIGAEEQLKRVTGWIAVGFVAAAFILSLTGI